MVGKLKLFQRKKRRRRASGCGTTAVTAVVCCIFLAFNGVLIGVGMSMMGKDLPFFLRHAKVIQMVVFVAPVFLLLIQWHLGQFAMERIGVFFRRDSKTDRK